VPDREAHRRSRYAIAHDAERSGTKFALPGAEWLHAPYYSPADVDAFIDEDEVRLADGISSSCADHGEASP
jgi:hypothetical protein